MHTKLRTTLVPEPDQNLSSSCGLSSSIHSTVILLFELYIDCNITTQLTSTLCVLRKTHIVSLMPTKDNTIRTIKLREGLRPAEFEVLKSGGLWDPKTEGEPLEPDVPAPEEDG